MKILHVVTDFSPEWGGVFGAVSSLAGALSRKVDVKILATARGKGKELAQGRNHSAEVLKTAGQYQFSIRIREAISKKVSEADLVHIHGLWQFPLSYAATVARRAKVPYVYHVHGMLNPWPLAHHGLRKKAYAWLWERKNLNGAARIICLNRREEESVKNFGVTAPTVVIPNGIDRTEFENLPPKGAFREKRPELVGKFLILFLGRIHKKKGIDLLLEAFSDLRHKFSRSHLLIAGPEEEKTYSSRLRRFVRARNLTDVVTFLGPVFGQAKKELLADADLFVLSSRDEGLSIAILEAMAAGLPVILTQGCNFREAESAGAGFVVAYDAGELSRAMGCIAGDEWLAKRMGINGRNLVMSNYGWDQIAAKVSAVYEEVIRARR